MKKLIKHIAVALLAFTMLLPTTVYADAFGIDVSAWQSNIQIENMSADTRFVIVKATEGTNYVSGSFTKQSNATLASGRKLGIYHFANGVSSAEAEAQHFVQTIQPYVGKAMLVLDWEDHRAFARGTSYAKTWCDTVYRLTGIKPVIYTTASVTRSYDWSAVANAGYKLWEAGYPYVSTWYGYKNLGRPPYTVYYFGAPLMWQYSSTTIISGYGSRLDVNLWYGDIANWDNYTKSTNSAASTEQPANPAKIPIKDANIDKSSVLTLVVGVAKGTYGSGQVRKALLGDRYNEVTAFVNHIYYADTNTLVNETLAGKYSSGETRKTVLGMANRYNAVQSAINARLNTTTTAAKKSVHEVALEIVRGTGGWGNGSTRVAKLKAAGYDATAVQNEVNAILSGKSNTTAKTTALTYYRIQAGDSLSKIAARYGTTVSRLASANGITNVNLIRAGQTIRIA